jgi:hypothetical protein
MRAIILHSLLFFLVIFSDRYTFMHPDDFGECTIAVISGSATPDGRPLLWKNRDVSNDIQKFCYFEPRMPHAETTFYAFIGNVYSADTNRVYMGVNEVGFAIINSNCYNLDDTLSRGIDDGELLRLALERCRSIEEFEQFLDYTHTKGRRDCWNIGAIDAYGGAMMYECANYSYEKYDAGNPDDAPDGIIVRTTFALSGGSHRPSMNRYKRAYKLAHERDNEQPLDAKYVLQTMSRDLFNYLDDPYPLPYTGQQNGRPPGFIFSHDVTINRNITRSVMVFRGVAPGEDPRLSTAFCTIGAPAISVAYPLWVLSRSIPVSLNFGQEVPMFSKVLLHRQMLYPLQKEPLYLNSQYLKNDNGTGLYEYIFPLENESIAMADSCLQLWSAQIPTSSEIFEAQQFIASYVYFNYSQIPYLMSGLEQPFEFSAAEISCYPNPFNSSTVIYLSGFDSDSEMSVNVYDLLGRRVRSFRGIHGPEISIPWDGNDDYSNRLSSGVYFVRAENSEFAKTVKTLLIK